jgi:hypothetical protein
VEHAVKRPLELALEAAHDLGFGLDEASEPTEPEAVVGLWRPVQVGEHQLAGPELAQLLEPARGVFSTLRAVDTEHDAQRPLLLQPARKWRRVPHHEHGNLCVLRGAIGTGAEPS